MKILHSTGITIGIGIWICLCNLAKSSFSSHPPTYYNPYSSVTLTPHLPPQLCVASFIIPSHPHPHLPPQLCVASFIIPSHPHPHLPSHPHPHLPPQLCVASFIIPSHPHPHLPPQLCVVSFMGMSVVPLMSSGSVVTLKLILNGATGLWPI